VGVNAVSRQQQRQTKPSAHRYAHTPARPHALAQAACKVSDEYILFLCAFSASHQ